MPMTVRRTLSFTDRHHSFLVRKVEEGVFASISAVVAAAIDAMMEDEIAREAAAADMADAVRVRMATPVEEHLRIDDAFAEARARLARAREVR
jgi:Arc/MetJ-type ribon-helix-helix transcriptional regulator